VRFVKGHGTENDFVVLPDLDGELDPDLVRRLCDRRAGLGADGVLAVVTTPDGYFMDYRNADGSLAQMCGNGIRVFARVLVHTGLASPGEMVIGTRSGPKRVCVPADGGDIRVEMGSPQRLSDAVVSIGADSWTAAGWSMGNPHLVVSDVGSLDRLDLGRAPVIDPADAFPDGVNVEFIERVGPAHLRMRVHERGSGETRSCGTGACAVAVATMAALAERVPYLVDVPGGCLAVEWRSDGQVTLSGPAVLVACGELDPAVIHSRTA